MSLEFRLIEIEKRDPYTIAAMDQAILEECEAGRSPPTLMYHNWEPAVSIAINQTLNDLNCEECDRRGFQVVRVRSGGKAVVHVPDTEFSYSLFVPTQPRDVTATYKTYCGRLGAALASFGLPATVVSNNDIFVDGKKIGGNAQIAKQRFSLQHGVILYHVPDARVMMQLMNPNLYPPSAADDLANILTGFTRYAHASQEELREGITNELVGDATLHVGTLTVCERQRVRELIPIYRQSVHDSTAKGVRGLCWLPAPAYIEEKQRRVEVPCHP